jgi:hypothetical protein
MNPECRLLAKSFFLLTNETPHCYEGTNGGCYSQMMTDESQTVSGFQSPRRAQDLSPEQRSLVELMHAYQFGRIENMPIRGGQPILDSNLKVIRVARLGAESGGAQGTTGKDFELKKQVRDLFERLGRLQDGTVISLEFRHGLPFLLETTGTFHCG